MFGGNGLGGALKNLGSKAEELLEKKKKEVEELAVQKKNMATELLQTQIKKTGELLTQTVSDAEKVAVSAAEEAKHEAIDAFDAEVAKVEKAVDDGLNQAATTVDSKLKEADQFLDKKREEVVSTVESTKKQTEESVQDASTQLLGKARGLLNSVFPTLNLHDHDQVRMSANDQDRQKKLLQNRGKSLELKEVLEKEKNDAAIKNKAKNQASGSKTPNGKTEQQKTTTKSEQKAQQKLEKEQQKLEKEQQKEQHKLEKEHQKEQLRLEKEQKKSGMKSKTDFCTSLKDGPQLKTQKSVDLSFLKHQKSVESPRHFARKSVDMQYKQDLLDPPDFSSLQSKSKK